MCNLPGETQKCGVGEYSAWTTSWEGSDTPGTRYNDRQVCKELKDIGLLEVEFFEECLFFGESEADSDSIALATVAGSGAAVSSSGVFLGGFAAGAVAAAAVAAIVLRKPSDKEVSDAFVRN